MPFFPEAVRKIKRVKTRRCKKTQGYDAVAKYATPPVVVEDVEDVFNFPSQLGHDGIVNDKIPLFLGYAVKIDGFKNLGIYFVHKRPPPVAGVVFEPIEAVLFTVGPLTPAFFTKTVDRFDLEQRQNQQNEQQVIGAVALFLGNVAATQPGSEIQGTKGAIKLYVRIIRTIFQVILNFAFKLNAVCGRHNERAPFVILFLFSTTYTYHKSESFSTLN